MQHHPLQQACLSFIWVAWMITAVNFPANVLQMFCSYENILLGHGIFYGSVNISAALQEMVQLSSSSNTTFDAQFTNIFGSRPQNRKRMQQILHSNVVQVAHFLQLHLIHEILKIFHVKPRCLCCDTLYKLAVSWKTGVTQRASRLDDFAQGYFSLFFSQSDFDLCRVIDKQRKQNVWSNHNQGHQGSIVPVKLT